MQQARDPQPASRAAHRPEAPTRERGRAPGALGDPAASGLGSADALGGTGDANGATDDSGRLNYSIIDLIKFGGWVGYVIIFFSFVAVALIIDYMISIRRGALAPKKDVAELQSLVEAKSYGDVAAKLENGSTSFLTQVVARGFRERDRGYEAVCKAMEDTAEELTGRLLRKIEHLNIIANIAPMLGLLGTVMGMVNSFNQISVSVGGVDPRHLAGGIFEALMTTVMGLIVAIPALYAFGIFRKPRRRRGLGHRRARRRLRRAAQAHGSRRAVRSPSSMRAPGVRVKLTAMIDMAFLLITFFIMSIRFGQTSEEEITLPKADQATEISDHTTELITVGVTGEGYYVVSGVRAQRGRSRRTLPQPARGRQEGRDRHPRRPRERIRSDPESHAHERGGGNRRR